MKNFSSSLVNGPTPALLRFLRSRLPTDEGMMVLLFNNGVLSIFYFLDATTLNVESATSTPGKDDVVAKAARLSLSSKVIH